jgi:CRISPR/Cas system CMR subunit Cmr6 (Cas7 group RAMP superfamily)
MKELVKKIAQAKKEIKESKLKKEGKNTYSNYEYFTPSQIEYLVQSVCNSNQLMTKFDLKRNELGVFGVLTIFDLETGDSLNFEMATAIPEIKATNIAQQLGGCVTYTERYLKTSAFGITDNNLDFDSQDNRPKVDHSKILSDISKINNESKLYEYHKEELKSTSNAAIVELLTKRKLEINGK